MIKITDILQLADAFLVAAPMPDTTLSNRIFKDSKKLSALRNGAGITVARFNRTLVWFSTHWPDSAIWPAGVPRPEVTVASSGAV